MEATWAAANPRLSPAAPVVRAGAEAPLALTTRGFELELAFLTGRLVAARALARDLVKIHPQSARIRFLAGRVAYAGKDYRAAVEAFEQSLRLHRHWRSKLWLGKALTQAGDYARAEPLLLELLADRPSVALDLGWLYERRGDLDQAAEQINRHLKQHPEDEFAQQQRLRVESRRASVETLHEEIETLQALDETPPPAMLPAYIEQLLTSARGAEARRFIKDHSAAWDPQLSVSIGWVCYHNYARDLAYDLFVRALPGQLTNYKLLNSLEAAARHCQREADLIERYGELAAQQPGLYGRIKRLSPS